MNNKINTNMKLITFKDYAEIYLETIGKMKLKENTYYQYIYILSHYIFPLLGNMIMTDITVLQINQCFYHLSEDNKLSPTSLVRMKGVISPIFAQACREGFILNNPVTYCTLPRKVSKEKVYADTSQCKKIINYAKTGISEQLSRAIIVLLYTGIRSGELCALHWDDIDFKTKSMTIKYTLYRRKGETICTDPKTESSLRVIALSDEVLTTLMDQKKYVAVKKQCSGDAWIDTNAVFINKNGGYLNGQYLNNEFKRLQIKSNCQNILHIHDLRHANASILINAGVPLKIVSEHLGHSNTQITEKFYTHIFKDNRKMTADVISNALS